jgi:tetratricopeptide (TPR) repeat protein
VLNCSFLEILIDIKKFIYSIKYYFITEFKINMEEEKEMDAYLKARSYERDAREKEKKGDYEAALESWERYAKVKEGKGSYLLSIHGYSNVARICDKVLRWKEAAEYYEAASKLADKIESHSLWALLMNLACQMYEKAGDYDACKNGYETIGNFFEAKNSFFEAADAYEHAAEMMLLSGDDISGYEAPIKAWKKNHEYWKGQGEMDDAEWSLKRITTYRTIQNKLPLEKKV